VESLSEKEVLILGVIQLWRVGFPFFLHDLATQLDVESWASTLASLWEAPMAVSVKVSIAQGLNVMLDQFLKVATEKDPAYKTMSGLAQASTYVFRRRRI
jgi:hypothetical protein